VLTGDDTTRLWDAASGQEVHRFAGHDDVIHSVAFSPDGRLVLTGSGDKTARLWDVTSGQEVRRFPGHGAWVSAVAFSPDGSLLLTGSADMTRLWEAATGRELARFLHFNDGESLVKYGDGRYWGSAGVHKLLKLKRGDETIEVPADYRTSFFGERTLDDVIAALNAKGPTAATGR
jgi:WD40 repeat protein